jgi:hypothetical protein
LYRTALTVSDVSADAAADAEDVLGLFHGGRWSLSWLTSTTERDVRVRAGPGMELEAAWDATGANALASQLLARRRRVYRVGACESSSNRAVSSLAATDDDDDDGASDDASSVARGKGGGGEGGACANAFAETTADADDEENENVVAVEARLGGGALGGVLRCAFPPPPFDATAHLATARCDAAAASLDEYPYPVGDSVTLRMTRAQRDVFDGGRAFLRGTWEEMLAAKSDMRLSVVLGGDPRGSDVSTYDWSNTRPGFDDVEPPLAPRPSGSSAAATPLRAKAKFRGVSSFRDCVRRKSLKVNVKGKTKLRLARGAASDRFLLISMCYDDRYLKTALVAGMAAELDVFPHAYGYVRLLVENPAGPGGDAEVRSTLVSIRPRWRGERRSLRTFPGASLRPPLAFNPRPRRLSTPTDAFQLHPDVRLYRTAPTPAAEKIRVTSAAASSPRPRPRRAVGRTRGCTSSWRTPRARSSGRSRAPPPSSDDATTPSAPPTRSKARPT